MSVQGAELSGSQISDLTSILRIPSSYTEHRPYQVGRFGKSRSNSGNRGDNNRTTNETELNFIGFNVGGSHNENQDLENDEIQNGSRQAGHRVHNANRDFQGFSTSRHNENHDLEIDEVPRDYQQNDHTLGQTNSSTKTRGNKRATNGNELDFSGSGRNENLNLGTYERPQSCQHETIGNNYTRHSGNALDFAGLPSTYLPEHAQPNLPRNTRSTHSDPSNPSPRYPNYSTKSARIASYKSWSKNLKTVEEMAEGGFFHAVSSNGNDCVRCFQCGIGLRNWDPEDDPWVEHARWSSKCTYLRLRKGQAFIDLVQAAVRQAEIDEALSSNAGNNKQSDDIEADTPVTNGADTSSYKPSPTEKRNPLLTVAAQSVLDMGYLPRIVKKAVDEILDQKGWNGMTGSNILQVVFRYEEELQRNKDKKQAMTKTIKVPSNDFARHKMKSISKSKDYKTLRTENEEFKEQKTCKICCEETVSIVFLPCGHLVCCAQCSPALKDCPICRKVIKGTVRVCLADDKSK